MVKPVYAMAVAPHPFDNDLGVGGTVASWVKQGKDVIYVICTNGDKASSDPAVKPKDLAKIRIREQKEAAKILGVREVIFLPHADLTLEYTPELRHEILRLLLTYRPEIVVVNDPYYRFRGYFTSVDHRAVGQAVMDAVWPYALAPGTYPDLLAEGLTVHKVKEVLMWQTDNPNYLYDITDTFDIKVKALACHKAVMMPPPPGGDSTTGLRTRAETAAKGASFKLAEAFHRVEVLQQL